MATRNVPRAIALKLAQTLFFTLMYATVKLADRTPVGEVVFFRSFFALIPVVIFTSMTGGLSRMVTMKRPKMHLIRGINGSVAMFFNFAAVLLLPLVTLTAFSFLSPVLMVVLSIPLLGEKIGPWRWLAVILGFAGVLLMIEPHGGLASILHLNMSLGLLCALIYVTLNALTMILMRKLTQTEYSEAMVFYFMSWCAIVGAVSMFFQFTMPTGRELFWLIATGILGGIGQIFYAYCYRYAEPSLLAPFDYTAMPWAMLLGWFVFGEMPEAIVLVGACVVVAAGLIIIWRTHVRRKHPPLKNPLSE